MPSRWQVVVPGVDPALVRLEYVHAVVSGWFDADDVAHRAHDKAYQVSPPVAHPAGTLVEVGLLDDGLAARLCERAAPGVSVRFGGQMGRITGEPVRVAALDWAELARPSGANAWSLRFLTPVTFRRDNSFTPWPAPTSVLASLRETWRQAAPPELPELVLPLPPAGTRHEPLWVTDIDGASDVVKVNGRTVSGFVGRIRYACDGPPELAGAIDRLMRLAPFAGLGAQRGLGFGLVRLEPTWHHG